MPLKLSNVTAAHLPTRYRIALLRTALQTYRLQYLRHQQVRVHASGGGDEDRSGAKEGTSVDTATPDVVGLKVEHNTVVESVPVPAAPSPYDYRKAAQWKEQAHVSKNRVASEVAEWLSKGGIVPRPERKQCEKSQSEDSSDFDDCDDKSAFVLEF